MHPVLSSLCTLHVLFLLGHPAIAFICFLPLLQVSPGLSGLDSLPCLRDNVCRIFVTLLFQTTLWFLGWKTNILNCSVDAASEETQEER